MLDPEIKSKKGSEEISLLREQYGRHVVCRIYARPHLGDKSHGQCVTPDLPLHEKAEATISDPVSDDYASLLQRSHTSIQIPYRVTDLGNISRQKLTKREFFVFEFAVLRPQ